MAYTKRGDRELTLEQLANRAVWVKALLSGNYAQGRMRLRRSDAGTETWCCLGVAGHALDPNLREVSEERAGKEAVLPFDWAQDKLDIGNDQLSACHWNDKHEFSFREIADRVALATVKAQSFSEVNNPPELKDETPGEYAKAWLASKV